MLKNIYIYKISKVSILHNIMEYDVEDNMDSIFDTRY